MTQAERIKVLELENSNLKQHVRTVDEQMAEMVKMKETDQKLRFHEHAVSKAYGLLSKASPCLGVTFSRSLAPSRVSNSYTLLFSSVSFNIVRLCF